MDDRNHSISPDSPYAWHGRDAAPIIVDVRRDADFDADSLVATALHCSLDDVEQWRSVSPSGHQAMGA
jgi:hypothetical protein